MVRVLLPALCLGQWLQEPWFALLPANAVSVTPSTQYQSVAGSGTWASIAPRRDLSCSAVFALGVQSLSQM